MQITKNAVVEFHYSLSDANGEIENSRKHEPVLYLHGQPGLIDGLVDALEGHEAGDRFTVELSAEQAPDTVTNHTLTIHNNGGVDLQWTIAEEAMPAAVQLDLGAGNADVAASTLSSPFSLILDGGVGSNSIGLTAGGQFLWFNRFTPQSWNFPVTIDEVQIMFGYPDSIGGVNVGELVDIYLYEDADGNPINGATHRGTLNDQQVQAVDGTTWSVYPLTTPVTFEGPGDILIAVVNRTAGVTAGAFPAVIDQLSGSQQRSWLGLASGNPGDPPEFTAFSQPMYIVAEAGPDHPSVSGFDRFLSPVKRKPSVKRSVLASGLRCAFAIR